MYWHVTTRNSQKCCSTYWVYDIVCVYIKHKATINLNRFVASLNLWICFYMVRVVLALRPYIMKCASSHQHHINAKITNSSSSKNIEEKKKFEKARKLKRTNKSHSKNTIMINARYSNKWAAESRAKKM